MKFTYLIVAIFVFVSDAEAESYLDVSGTGKSVAEAQAIAISTAFDKCLGALRLASGWITTANKRYPGCPSPYDAEPFPCVVSYTASAKFGCERTFSKDPREKFWSYGTGSIDGVNPDYESAQEDATNHANKMCTPLVAERVSEWSNSIAGRFAVARASALFTCREVFAITED